MNITSGKTKISVFQEEKSYRGSISTIQQATATENKLLYVLSTLDLPHTHLSPRETLV